MDVEAYRKDGLLIIKDVFAGGMQEQLQALCDQILSGIEAGSISRQQQFLGGAIPEVQRIALHPALIKLSEDILDNQDICLYFARVLMKDTHWAPEVDVHQDYPYFQDGQTSKLNIFLAVTPCHAGNGMLTFYRGSHRYGPLPRGRISVELCPQFEPFVPSLEVGDALLADFLLWHGSIPAAQPEPRIMVQIVFQPADDPSAQNIIRDGRLYPKTPFPRYPMDYPEPSFSYPNAREAFEAGDYAGAYKLACGLITRDPNSLPVQLLLHDIALVNGDKVTAEKFLDQARAGLVQLEREIGRRE